MVAGRGANCGRGGFGASIGSCNTRVDIVVDTLGFVSVKQRPGQSRFGALVAKLGLGQCDLGLGMLFGKTDPSTRPLSDIFLVVADVLIGGRF